MINYRYARKFCNGDIRRIENYSEAAVDQTQVWHCHHKLELCYPDGTPRPTDARLSMADLKAQGKYYGVPAEELIFLTKSEHMSLHNKNKLVSAEVRKKMSESHKGMKGKKHSDDAKHKISKKLKGRQFTDEWRKKLSEAQRGKPRGRFYNNGVINVRAFECPEGFIPGRLKKQK